MIIARDNRSGMLMQGEIKDNKFVVESGPDFNPVFDIFDLSEVSIDSDAERVYDSTGAEVCGLPDNDPACESCAGCLCNAKENKKKAKKKAKKKR